MSIAASPVTCGTSSSPEVSARAATGPDAPVDQALATLLDRLHALDAERRAYTVDALPTHLARAGQAARLSWLLRALPFLSVKLATHGPQALLDDLDLALALPRL